MLEVGTAIAELDEGGHVELLLHFLLKGLHVDVLYLLGGPSLLVPVHVQQGGAHQLGGHEAHVELSALVKLLHEAVGDNLTSLVVTGVVLEHLGLKCPVLVDLRGHLDKVTVGVGAGQAAIFHAGEHAVQRMAKLMEEGLHIVPGEQRGGVARRTSHITHIIDDGTNVGALIAIGFLHGIHPCAGSLHVTRQVVGHEDSEVLALGILHIINLNLGVVLGSIGHLLEGEAVELVGNEEDTVLHHAVECEIGAHIVLAEVEFILLHLLGIVVIVASLNLGGIAMGGSILLHIGYFLVHLLDSGTPELQQQVLGSLGSLGHIGVGGIVGIGVEAEQVSLLLTQHEDVADVLAVVILVAMASGGDIGLVHLAAQVAAVGIGQHGQTGCCDGVEGPLALLALVGSELGCVVDDVLGKTLQLLLFVNKEYAAAQIMLNVVTELEVEFTQLAVDLLERVLLGCGQECTVTHELLVVLLGETLLDGIHTQLVGVVIDGLHLGKQAVVHVHAIALCGQLGHQGLGKLLHLGGVVTLAEGKQYT